MKKTQFKDILRNIWKQKVSFLSIIVIAVMGITSFLGIDYTATAVRQNGSDIYNRLNFRDIEVMSTLLLSEEDINDIKQVEGVADVETIWQTTAMMTSGSTSEGVKVFSMTERINLPDVVEGRLPESSSECIIELRTAESTGLKVGDKLTLLDAEGNLAKYLKYSDFTITGIANLPHHINRIVAEEPCILVLPEVFDSDGEELAGCYMKAEIVVEKPDGMNRFSSEYENTVAVVMERIEKLAETNAARRAELILKEFDDAFDKLEDAKAEVRDAIRTLVNSVLTSDEERAIFQWAEKRKADFNDPNETARYLYITDNIRIDLTRSPKEMVNTLISSDIISDKLLASIYEYVSGTEFADKNYDINFIRQILTATATGYAENLEKIAEGSAAWDKLHTEYIETFGAIKNSSAGRWIVLDMKGNASFVQMTVGSGNFSNLKMTFSLMFVVVGALVVFATVGKMIDEQRTLVGTTKALGFFNREIFVKYVSFGVLATLVGTFLSIAVARFFIEPLMLGSFNDYYYLDVSKPLIVASSTIIAVIAAIILSFAAVWFACNRLLREPAVRLMQPKTPGIKKVAAKGGKRVLSLYSRLILLNMRTDLKRVVVTIVSVAGCCALIIVGLTLRSSMYGSIDKQYGEIVNYDICVKYDPDAVKDDGKEFSDLFDANGAKYAKIYSTGATYNIKELQNVELFCGDIEEIYEFYHLDDIRTGKPIIPTDRGILIQRRIAESYGLDVGDEFELALGGVRSAIVRVAGVFENYIGRAIVMSGAYYEKVYEKSFTPNSFLVQFGDADAASIKESVKTLEGFDSVSGSDGDRALLESSMSTLNILVVLFIVIAGIMAGVVLLNLTNMYVMQKKREMTVMRINGFTVKEVKGYILRETVMTTILGIILGLGIGTGFAYSIVRTMEQSFFQMQRTPDFLAWLIAAALTVLFTVIVNAVALRKIKNLRLTDIA